MHVPGFFASQSRARARSVGGRGLGRPAPWEPGGRPADLIRFGCLFGAVVVLAAGGSAYDLRVLTVAGTYALAVLGYQIIFGHAGALSLAQGAFFGLGAYTSALLALEVGAPFEVTLPAAVALPCLLALIVGLSVIRLESHYIALATLGIGQVVLLLAVHAQALTGGANGLPGVPPIRLFGWTIAEDWAVLVLVWSLVAVAAVPVAALGRGRTGLAFAHLRQNPQVAASLGLRVEALRLVAFVASAAFAGAAGALTVHTQRVVSPEVLGFPVMVSILTMAVVGGRGRADGAILGALILVHLPEWLRGLDQAYRLAYGLLLLGAIVAAPDGLIGRLDAVLGRWARRNRPLPDAPPSGAKPVEPPCSSSEAGARRDRIGDPLLALSDVRKAYGGVQAVAGVSLTVRAGEIVALLGPNGSGKTTLLNLISGATPPGGGRMCLDGRALEDCGASTRARLGMARTFQAADVPPALSAGAAVAVAAIAPGRPPERKPAAPKDGDPGPRSGDLGGGSGAGAGRPEIDRDAVDPETGDPVDGAVWRLCLPDIPAETPCARIPPAALRRLELARALARRPRLLLVDEPVAGLGPTDRALVRRTLVAAAAQGRAVLMVEHDLAFVQGLAHRVLVMVSGRLVYDGAPDGLTADPTVRRDYLGLAAGAAPDAPDTPDAPGDGSRARGP